MTIIDDLRTQQALIIIERLLATLSQIKHIPPGSFLEGRLLFAARLGIQLRRRPMQVIGSGAA